MKNIPSFEKTLEKTNGWIKEIMDELVWEDGQRAYQALRTVLHGLRDRLRVEETAQRITKAVLGVLERRVSSGEINDIHGSLPKDIKRFWRLAEHPRLQSGSASQ